MTTNYYPAFGFIVLALAANNLDASNSTSAALMVSARVASSCAVNQSTLQFGHYDPYDSNASSPLQSSGAINVSCTKNTSATISLDHGLYATHAAGTTRAMANENGNEFLSYDIYTSSTYDTTWNESNKFRYTAETGKPTRIAVFGLIPAHQQVHDGTYHDIVTINAVF